MMKFVEGRLYKMSWRIPLDAVFGSRHYHHGWVIGEYVMKDSGYGGFHELMWVFNRLSNLVTADILGVGPGPALGGNRVLFLAEGVSGPLVVVREAFFDLSPPGKIEEIGIEDLALHMVNVTPRFTEILRS